MRLIIILTFSLLAFQSFGQNFILPDGEYMDTTTTPDAKDTNCISSPYYYYYSFGAKYPMNSTSLLNEVQAFMQKNNTAYSICSGTKSILNYARLLLCESMYM